MKNPVFRFPPVIRSQTFDLIDRPVLQLRLDNDDNSIAPENNTAQQNQQETDWPDAPAIQIPGVSSTTSDQPPEVTYNRH